jgi:hypothetical protein
MLPEDATDGEPTHTATWNEVKAILACLESEGLPLARAEQAVPRARLL